MFYTWSAVFWAYLQLKQIDFSMGPSVKFVLAIIDSVSPQKMVLKTNDKGPMELNL